MRLGYPDCAPNLAAERRFDLRAAITAVILIAGDVSHARPSASSRCEENSRPPPGRPRTRLEDQRTREPDRCVATDTGKALQALRQMLSARILAGRKVRQARRKLVRAPPGANVTEIAADCGFNHLGRFAIAYRDRYGECPSDTLRWSRIRASAPIRPRSERRCSADRPSLAVFPFDLIGPAATCVIDIGDEIAAALCRTGWIGSSACAGRPLSAPRAGVG